MKFRDIIGCLLMIILTVAGIVISFGLSISSVLNSDGIVSSMIEERYIDESEQEAKKIFNNYMGEQQTEQVLDNISVKSNIRQIAQAFDNNTVKQVANGVKEEVKGVIKETLDDTVSNTDKESFSTIVSDAYIKAIFPVNELDILSGVYNKYGEKLSLILVIAVIVSIIIYIYLALGKKTYKWAIISLYNIILINIVGILSMGVLNNIVIGNERTTSVVLNMLGSVKLNIWIVTAAICILSVISNYIAYFRKRRHSV